MCCVQSNKTNDRAGCFSLRFRLRSRTGDVLTHSAYANTAGAFETLWIDGLSQRPSSEGASVWERKQLQNVTSSNECALPNTKGGKSTFLFPGNEPMQQMHANHAQATTFPISSSCLQASTSATECSSNGSLPNWSKQVSFWLKHRKDNLQIKSWGCPFICISRDAEYVIVHWASQTGGFKATSSSVYLYLRTRRKTTPSTYTHPSTVETTSAATITADQNTHDRLLGGVMRF